MRAAYKARDARAGRYDRLPPLSRGGGRKEAARKEILTRVQFSAKPETEALKVIRNYYRRGRRDLIVTPSFCAHR